MGPATSTSCQRSGERFWLWRAGEATVEYSYPDGCNWCCDLLNVSEGGICFGLMDEQQALDPGLRIVNAVLCVADVDIEGTLVIVHITESLSAGRVCGAEFIPSTDSDKEKIAGVISKLRPEPPGE